MIKNEDLPEDIKEKAKDIVLDEYRSGKKERLSKKKERIQNFIGIDDKSESEEKPKKTGSKKQAVEKKQENSANDVSESDGSIV